MAPDNATGWDDPADAIFSAANYLHASGAPADWQQAIFTYNHSQVYVDQVLNLAQTLYTAGLGKTGAGAATAPLGAGSCASVDIGGYTNPLAHIQGLHAGRIDMGVDYSGAGPIVAIGSGQITTIHNAGWPNGTFLEERLTTGQYAGRYWYYAEDITSAIQPGERSRSDSQSARCSRAAQGSRPAGLTATAATLSPPRSARSRPAATPAAGQPPPAPQQAACSKHSARHQAPCR